MQSKTHFYRINVFISFVLSLIVILISLSANPVDAKGLGLQQPHRMDGVIAYVELDGDIYLFLGETGERIQLTADANQYRYSIPRFSPDGRYLAFLKTDPEKGESRYDLHVMNLETKETKLLIENLDDWGNFNWSPDSRSIVYGYRFEMLCQAPDQTSTYGIWQVQLDTGAAREIVSPRTPSAPLKSPEFSFDGNWLSFESFPCFSEGFQLQTIEISTDQIYDFGFGEADWSPNQNRLAWSQEVWAGGDGGIVLLSPNQGEKQTIQEAGNLSTGDPRWSPDGQWIAFRRYTFTDGLYIFSDEMTTWEDYLVIARVDGSEQKMVCSSEDIWGCRMVEWSPSGSQIIYTVNKDDTVDWYLYTLSTGESVNLSEFGEGGIDWMPSSRLPQVNLPTVEPTQVAEPAQPSKSEVDPEPLMTPTALVDNHPETTSIGINTIIGSSIVICGGAGLILLSVVAVIFFVIKRKK